MASLVPYDRFGRAISRWPFDAFDEFFDSPLASLSSSSNHLGFKMNVEDAGQSYVVSAELPGVSREMIDVELNEGRLSISAEKKETEEEKSKNYLHKETTEWKASRGVYLKDAATSGLSAKLEDGILTVSVPKREEDQNVTKVTID